MFDKKYHQLIESISPDEALVQRTVAAAERSRRAAETNDRESPADRRKLSRKLIPAVAAALIAVIALGAVILSPAKVTGSFAIVASAETTGETALNASEFKPISDIAAAYSDSNLIGVNLSLLYAFDDKLTLADDPIMIATGLFTLKVEGEDIKCVTYSLSNGKFEVSDNTAWKLRDYEGKTDIYLGQKQEYAAYYDSITFSYDNQLSQTPSTGSLFGDGVFMYVPRAYDPAQDGELLDRFLSLSALKYGNPGELEPEEEFCSVYEDFMNNLYRDTKIIVTVTYKDDRTETVMLTLNADCTVNGKATRRYRIGSGDGEDAFASCDVYSYTVTLNAKIEE